MGTFKFRPLKADEVECRIGTVTSNGATLLLYKTARTDMDLLDETVGPENWQTQFYELGGKLFCKLGIRIHDEWVWKDDCGVEGNVGDEKSQASDARKRAGFAWGIGRELYRSPFIFAKIPVVRDGNRYKPDGFPRFDVTEFESDGIRVTRLTIVDDKGTVVKKYNAGIASRESGSGTGNVAPARQKDVDPALLPGGVRFNHAVEMYANGQPVGAKTAREVWSNNIKATPEQIAAFDEAVANYKINNNLL